MLLISRNFFFFKFALFILISSNIAISQGAKNQGNKHYHVLHIDPPSSTPNCSAHTTGLGSHGMKLIITHLYGPCSPFANSVEVRSSDEILVKNEARVQWLNSRISNSNSHTTTDESDVKSVEGAPSLDDGAYLTTIGLGTPKVDYKVMIDTGSDYTWVRCRPCKEGCTSTSPLFDPSKSSTYRNGSDEFRMVYGDNSSTKGLWSYDTLTLEPSHLINTFKFGCGQYNVDQTLDFSKAAGILGLGRGEDSLVSQSASNFGKIFGYCFPKSRNNVGYLLFGDEARESSSASTLQYTNLLTNPPVKMPSVKYLRDSLYFLQLVGISVGGKRLNIESGVFTSVGTVIDSGTVVTHLPKKAYDALSFAFNQSMSAYQRAPPLDQVLDTCFIVKRGQRIVIPSITFHFAGGTDVALDQSGIGWTPEEKDIWCLGFTATKYDDDLTIIGSTQQREMEVLYDVEAGKIGFGRKSCGS